jgi:dehydrogenase/reductase SDR family protein 1
MVTGASRGVGRGIAIGLGEAGYTVYVTGRTLEVDDSKLPLPGSLTETAAAVDRAGSEGIPVRCDHLDDGETERVFERIAEEQGRLDVLVNNVWGGYEHFYDGTEFWKERGFWTAPASRWDKMFAAGVRAHYVASVFAARMMVEQGSGLIVNVSSFAAFHDQDGVAYGVSKAADVRMAACMAPELREHGVAVVSLLPGLVRTESVLRAAEHFDLSNSESPEFQGRAVAALAADAKLMEKTGRWLITAELAEEYGFSDVDGKQPRSMRGEWLDMR